MPVATQPVAELSVDQVASLLRVNRMTVTRFWNPAFTAAADQLRPQRYGITWRVRDTDLAKFLNHHTVTPEGQEPIVVTATELPRLHTLDEVSASTHLPLRWLEKACREERVPHVRAGRARLMTPDQAHRTVEIYSKGGRPTSELATERDAYVTGRRASRTPRRRAA